ncbi:MAG: Imm32 family immunity protein [Terriglobia bacterium]|nr:Imm32 family immunity protein [Terriglobia bacterium]
MLTVEYGNDVVEINCDEPGLDLLIRKLQLLKQHGGHQHLMTPSWAGDELTEEKQGPENILIHHLRIALAPKAENSPGAVS